MKSAWLFIFFWISSSLFAETPFTPAEKNKVAQVFHGEKACFVLKALNNPKPSLQIGKKICQNTKASDESLLFPLAVAAVEKGLIQDDKTLFKWDGIQHPNPAWNKDQFVTDWLHHQVAWVTDRLILQMGRNHWDASLKLWNWQTPSLEQSLTTFVSSLFSGKLPVKPDALAIAQKLFYLGKFRFGAEVWGIRGQSKTQAWFTGLIKVKNQEWVFTTILTPSKSPEPLSGERAQALNMDALTQLELF